MGANVSSYPHSCSSRFVGNSQAQQTLIGWYLSHIAGFYVKILLECVCVCDYILKYSLVYINGCKSQFS